MQICLVDGNLQREMQRCPNLERSIYLSACDQPLHQNQLFLSVQTCADLTTECQCMESSNNFFSVAALNALPLPLAAALMQWGLDKVAFIGAFQLKLFHDSMKFNFKFV